MNHEHYCVIESFSQAKSEDPRRNEDRIYLGRGYAAVVDGATGTNKATFQGKTGGQLCADAALAALDRMSGNETPEEAMELIRGEIARVEQTHSLRELGVHCCAVAAIYSCARREIWLIGDCSASAGGTTFGGAKRIDTVFAEVRSIMIHALLKAGKTEEELLADDVSRSLILPLIDRQRPLENAEDAYGYSVLNGSQAPRDIRVFKVEPGMEVALASDGYPAIFPTLEETERYLLDAIRDDPLCYRRIQATKGVTQGCVSYDDRSYLRFKVLK